MQGKWHIIQSIFVLFLCIQELDVPSGNDWINQTHLTKNFTDMKLH